VGMQGYGLSITFFWGKKRGDIVPTAFNFLLICDTLMSTKYEKYTVISYSSLLYLRPVTFQLPKSGHILADVLPLLIEHQEKHSTFIPNAIHPYLFMFFSPFPQ
jgi:hypothetical protein